MSGRSADQGDVVAVWSHADCPLTAEGLGRDFYTAVFPVEAVSFMDCGSPGAVCKKYKAAIVEVDVAANLARSLELIHHLRDQDADVMILALVKKLTGSARVKLYKAGCDDCIGLPVDVGDFASLNGVAVGNEALALDLRHLCLWRNGEQVQLSFYEFKVLSALSCARGRIASREELVRLLDWSPEGYDQRALEKFMSRLRAKIKEFLGGEAIQSVRGYGYRLSRRLPVLDSAGADLAV